MLYNIRTGPDFEAIQWNKNGDHPDDYNNEVTGLERDQLRTWTGEEAKALEWEAQVVRYFRVPDPEFSGDKICPLCGKTFHEHGWIEEDKLYKVPGDELIETISLSTNSIPKGTVCPGNYVATFYVFADERMEGSKPKMDKRYMVMEQKLFEKIYVPVNTL